MKPITDPRELFRHQRQVRAFSDQPVDDETLREVLQAAVHGPSGSNTMPWRFIVVRDPEVKARLNVLYEEAFSAQYGGNPPPRGGDRQPLTEVPVLVVACVRTPRGGRAGFQTGASVYPSVQNLLLAARVLGLGSGITTLHRIKRDEVHEVLGIPDGWDSAAIVLLGWPDRNYGPNKRPPLEDFITHDRWTDPPQRR
jgi:nitroreductase